MTATNLAASAYLTPSERAAHGKAVRAWLPRSSHARFEPEKRPDPLGILEQQSASRVPELVPIRYERMLESPFRFFRGAAAIMATDLGHAPHTGITTQLCGDAHLLNFRLLASPERHLIFDINDFDETLPGPWEWDVKRLAASLVIAARANGLAAGPRPRPLRGPGRRRRLPRRRRHLRPGAGGVRRGVRRPEPARLRRLRRRRTHRPDGRRDARPARRAPVTGRLALFGRCGPAGER